MATVDAKQRLLAVRVGEVSLVDHPANEEEFLIVKNKDGTSEAKDGKPVIKAELDPYTAMCVTINAARDRLYAVTDMMRDHAKLPDAIKEMEEIKTMLDNAAATGNQVTKDKDAAAAADPITVAKQAVEAATAALEKGKGKKMPPEMMEQMKTLLETVKGYMTDPEEDKTETKAQKAAVVDADADAIVVQGDGSIVLKGKKQFSKERVTALKGAVGHLLGMVKDADPAVFAELMSGFQTAPADSGIAKAKTATDDTQAPAWAKPLIEGVANVTKRVDDMEKAAAVSKSLPQDGNPDKPVDKSKGTFWKGVL